MLPPQPSMEAEDMTSEPQSNYDVKRKSKKRKKIISGNVEAEQQERDIRGEPSKLRFSCQRGKENDGESIDLKEDSPWRNLQLILSLQDKNIDLLRKVGLAFDYAKTSSIKDMYETSQCSQVMNTSRTLVYLNNWVHSVLISSEKKTRLEENKCNFNTSGSYLDFRCWKILHFCLEQSKDLHNSLTCSKDFLRVVRCIIMDASFCVHDVSSCHAGALSDELLEFYDVVLACTKLIFSFHGGVANENLDLWINLIDELLKLILKIVQGQLDGSQLGIFASQLSYCLLEPFAKFLRVHPTRKNGFRDFIDKLFEPLLCLLHVLHCDPSGNNIEWKNNLSKLIKDVLAHGLFNPTHIDGFLSLQSPVRYRNSSEVTLGEEKLVNKSYHRHLFNKVEAMVVKNESALIGLGQLLHLFVSCIAKHKGASCSVGGFRQSDVRSTSRVPSDIVHSGTVIMNENSECHILNAELRSSVFNFFAQIMEYLLANVNTFLQSDVEEVSVLLSTSNTLRSISMLLNSVCTEKVYLRMEDTSDGASRKFLKVIYDMVILLFAKITHLKLSCFGSDERSLRELLVSARKELIITLHHLLNIEYEVVGDDLEKLWTLVLTSMNFSYLSTDVFDRPVLSVEILSLGCRLIDLYSELRQVNSSISALCKAVRQSISILGDDESCTPSHHSDLNAINMLLCSLEFRLSLSNAIKTIPEGQTAECIHRLSSDIVESLNWMRFEHQLAVADEISKPKLLCFDSEHVDLQAEILGKALSEVYVIILDSITINCGNSYLVGVSVKNLIEVISSSLSNVVPLEPFTIKNFSIVVDGRALHNSTGCKNVSICWILVFMCRLLMSCRSLFRQVISLIPPGTSKKMSRLIGDSFTMHSARDWLELSGLADKGSLSWILWPSASFHDVIHSISGICIQDSAVLCPPLVYILHAMAIMRLVDLNKLIESSEYVLHLNQTCNQSKLKDEADLSSCPKRIRKWTRHISKMREEAADLTKFMMEFLSSESKDLISTSSVDVGSDDKFIQYLNNNVLSFPVGFINEDSLPCALYRIICRNVDIWCSHATRKHLKNFVSLLIRASISNVRNAVDLDNLHNIGKPGPVKKVSAHQIALEFLSNTITYEQGFVCRYMASRFCTVLQKSALFLSVTTQVDLSKSPDWDEVISALGNLSDEGIGYFPLKKSSTVPDESCNEHSNVKFSICQSLLTLLMRMPEDYFSLRSSSLYVTCILNLERLLVGSLLRWHGALNMQSTLEIFRLLVLCRRVLKNLTAASCKENINGQSELPSKLPEYSFPLSWLPKSLFVVVGFRCTFPEDTSFELQFARFSLIDHTSNALLIVSRDEFARAFNSCISSKKLHKKRKELKLSAKEYDLSEGTSLMNEHEYLVAGKSVIHVAKLLKEFLKKSLDNFVDTCVDEKLECLAGFQELNKFSAIMACFQGLLWGLVSALVDINAVNCDLRIKLSSSNADLMTTVDSWVHTCVNFIKFCLKAVLLEDDTVLNSPVCDNNVLGSRESSTGGYDCSTDASDEGEMHPAGKMIPSDIKGDIVGCNLKREVHAVIPKLQVLLTEVQHKKYCMKKNLLLELLKGENADTGFFLQQLFIACSAVLRLNLQINLNSISWSWVPIVLNISQQLLVEFSSSYEMTNQIAFVWLLGVVKFLEELGNYFAQFDPSLTRALYVKLVGLHIMAIGKCISLQGKEATLTSQERGLHVKMLASTVESQETSKLAELKARLRISFTSYIRKSSELHLLSAIQAVERALVGVQEGLITNYEILRGNSDGEVSSDVAAGVDCLYLILEFVTGHRRLNMIKRHIQSLVACLFNVILHLQAPRIFRGHIYSFKVCAGPDTGSVVLMCVEVLTKIYGKPSFFQIEAYHIAQSLRVPAPLFQYFLSLQISEVQVRTASGSNSNADQKFSAALYSACCRLLCTTLKHHKNETQQFIALLEDSVSVLLHSLEIVNTDLVFGRASYAWEVSKAVECASSLRRVYEEIKYEKEVFGKHASKFLSRYIWVYCGHGPAKTGMRREVDEALKPGIYALMDSCSVEDLQLLHTVFEEGPCRSTLAALQHDYKLNFQFQGKV